MKKINILKISFSVFILCVLLITGTGEVFAQSRRVELNPFAGYLLGGSLKFYQGKFKVEDNLCYGGNLAIQLDRHYLVEIGYTRMDTKGDWQPYYNYSYDFPSQTIDMSVNYLQIGTVKEIPVDNDKVRPYGTFTLGTTWFHPKVDNSYDEWLFSVAAGLGLKYFFNERVGIRLQARLLLPMLFNGMGFYFGIGGGGSSSGVYVSSYAPIVEGDFTGGLIFVLGK